MRPGRGARPGRRRRHRGAGRPEPAPRRRGRRGAVPDAREHPRVRRRDARVPGRGGGGARAVRRLVPRARGAGEADAGRPRPAPLAGPARARARQPPRRARPRRRGRGRRDRDRARVRPVALLADAGPPVRGAAPARRHGGRPLVAPVAGPAGPAAGGARRRVLVAGGHPADARRLRGGGGAVARRRRTARELANALYNYSFCFTVPVNPRDAPGEHRPGRHRPGLARGGARAVPGARRRAGPGQRPVGDGQQGVLRERPERAASPR